MSESQPRAQGLQVPILDLGPYFAGEPGALEQAAEQLRYIGENVGFHYIANHGVDQALIDSVFAETARFHAQPVDAKMALRVNEFMQGYMPMKSSTIRTSDLSQNNLPNLNEAFFVQREGASYMPPNQWPPGMPEFKRVMLAYYEALDRLAYRMLPLYAVALGVEPDYFLPAFQAPHSGLRVTHYPAAEYAAREFGLAPHTDSSFITLLAQNKKAGLQIKGPDGEWVDAPGIEGTMIVNSGDILNRWTNGRFRSTPHRAFNVDTEPRYAIPFFVHPDWRYRMQCVPTCCGPDNPPKYAPETTEEYFSWFAKSNYDHLRNR